ncbi:MAG: DUF2752 domain-containing protein [Maribacter sp.]|nr:DUF2752 domain-containing protein [Maribacter sp.]
MRLLITVFFLGIEDYMLPCFTKKIFGIECPGCGLQRAVAFLLHGKFEAAFHIYPAIYPLLFLLSFLLLNKLVNFKHANFTINFLAITTVSAILINYILKFI